MKNIDTALSLRQGQDTEFKVQLLRVYKAF